MQIFFFFSEKEEEKHIQYHLIYSDQFPYKKVERECNLTLVHQRKTAQMAIVYVILWVERIYPDPESQINRIRLKWWWWWWRRRQWQLWVESHFLMEIFHSFPSSTLPLLSLLLFAPMRKGPLQKSLSKAPSKIIVFL